MFFHDLRLKSSLLIMQPYINPNIKPSAAFYSNNALFIAQMFFSLFLISFSASMIYMGQSASIYLPIMTSVTSYWFPSPISNNRSDDQIQSNMTTMIPMIKSSRAGTRRQTSTSQPTTAENMV
jgi:hypothetical protein